MMREDFVTNVSAFGLFASRAMVDIAVLTAASLPVGRAGIGLEFVQLGSALTQLCNQYVDACVPPPPWLRWDMTIQCHQRTAQLTGLPCPMALPLTAPENTVGRLACIFERQVALLQCIQPLIATLGQRLADLATEEVFCALPRGVMDSFAREISQYRVLATAFDQRQPGTELRLAAETLTEYLAHLVTAGIPLEPVLRQEPTSRTALATAVTILRQHTAQSLTAPPTHILPLMVEHGYRYALALLRPDCV